MTIRQPEREKQYEPIVGWKGLRASHDGHLRSPYAGPDDWWPEYEPYVATCAAHPDHQPPVPNCGCGVYATTTFEALKANRYHWQPSGLDVTGTSSVMHQGDTVAPYWVLAEISLWGEAIQGAIGFRASRAYPKTIYVPAWLFAVGSRIRERYGVRLAFIDRFTGQTTKER